MEKAKKLWIPVLLGVLLITLMVGVAGAGENNRSSGALGPTAYITVPAAAFSPSQDEVEWYNYGQWIRNDSLSDYRFYAGPIVFPHAGKVQITQIVLVAYDNNSGTTAEACATLYRSKFLTGAEESMASICSTGSDPSVRRFATPNISPNEINPKYTSCYVSLMLRVGTEIRAYDVRIAYKPVL
jgi:hypothetical protein